MVGTMNHHKIKLHCRLLKVQVKIETMEGVEDRLILLLDIVSFC